MGKTTGFSVLARTAILALGIGTLAPSSRAFAQSQPARQPAKPAPSLPILIPKAGLVITHSARIKPGVYQLAAKSTLDSALITIRGTNISVDFTGVELRGSRVDASPDEATGIAVFVDGGRNVRVRGLRARGYRIGILARGVDSLTLTANDLSHSWKPRLFSVVEHESLVDWLSFHHNEKREWMRFGAGIYLDSVKHGEVSRNIVEQSMNGLMMNVARDIRVSDNSFSFNSGLGIGMYRSTDNIIDGNRIDYNVRGYSHGFFRRGQDSADILMFEQVSNNIVARNSATHGGDGLFLWAGQTTMDTGKDGANDNLFYENDFSFAPTNGMEATFSRNAFVRNRIEGSDNGLWGGYSYNSLVIGNCFARNRVGIAIEHGQDNAILDNRFDGDSTAIRLWGDSIEPSDWGYPKNRDTKSRDYRITGNAFNGTAAIMKIANTAVVDTLRNSTQRSAESGCSSISPPGKPLLMTQPGNDFVATISGAEKLNDVHARPLPQVALRDRSAIIVDEWGPFDWRSPKLWPIDSTHAPSIRLRVLGPAGRWNLKSKQGISTISSERGRVGDTITVTPTAGNAGVDWSLQLEYTGETTTEPNGTKHSAGTAIPFSYARYEPAANWSVRFFAWNDSTDFRKKPDAFSALLNKEPIVTRSESRLDYFWYRPTIAKLPQSKFALVATTTVNLSAGSYTLRTISDDAVRVWIDDALVIDHWTPHESELAYASLPGGKHNVRVQYAQVEGWSELRVEIVRGILKHSMGSAGPH